MRSTGAGPQARAEGELQACIPKGLVDASLQVFEILDAVKVRSQSTALERRVDFLENFLFCLGVGGQVVEEPGQRLCRGIPACNAAKAVGQQGAKGSGTKEPNMKLRTKSRSCSSVNGLPSSPQRVR